MPAFEVARTLVKSPPEVWAELEQAERLAALLGDDAIKITRTEPETAIEWQGTGASGRIEIEVSGWGTKVRLTTETEETETEEVAEVVEEPAPEAAIEPAPAPDPEPEAVAKAVPEMETVDDARHEIEADPEAAAVPTFWQRVKSWFNSEFEPPIDEPAPQAEPVLVIEPEPEPIAEAEPEPEPQPEPEPVPEPIDYEQRMVALLDHLGSAHKRPFVNA